MAELAGGLVAELAGELVAEFVGEEFGGRICGGNLWRISRREEKKHVIFAKAALEWDVFRRSYSRW